MTLAFIPALPLTASNKAEHNSLSTCHLHGRRLCATRSPHRYVPLQHLSTVCTMVQKDRKDTGKKEDDEVLDEAAMRAADIHEVMTGLIEFRQRIIDDATRLAKKVRAPKKQLEAALAKHPDILRIDGHLKELEEELRTLGDR